MVLRSRLLSLAGAAFLATLLPAAAASPLKADAVHLLPKDTAGSAGESGAARRGAQLSFVNPDHWQPGADVDVVDENFGKPVPRETIAYTGTEPAGTIVVSTRERRLYFVLPDSQAIRYGVGVGRPGYAWTGGQTVTAKREWPDWTPPAAMIRRRPEIPHHMAGGLDNPLGARAMYLGRTEYRIHGSNEPDTIGQAMSSGCIRMTNADVADLYDRVKVGTRVVVEP